MPSRRVFRLEQDHVIALVAVLGIVYIILFDGGRPRSPVLGSATPAPAPSPLLAPTLMTTAPVTDPLLAIVPRARLTPDVREQKVALARRLSASPIPGALREVEALYQDMRALAQLLGEAGIYLDPMLARSFADKLGEVRRYYTFQKASRDLEVIVKGYVIPSNMEKERLQSDLARLRELKVEIDWLESTASYTFPGEHKEYLRQLVEVLEGMGRI